MNKFRVFIGHAKDPVAVLETERPEEWVKSAYARVFTGGNQHYIRVESAGSHRPQVIRFSDIHGRN